MAIEYDLFVSIDCGGSQTKIIYQFQVSKNPDYILMPPEIEQVTKEEFKRYQQRQLLRGVPKPEDDAYLEWEGSIYVVGSFALEFAAQDRLKEGKYENALYKVLAAIGLILERGKVRDKKSKKEPHQTFLHLSLLLPWNEYGDQHRFQKQLVLMLKNFKFRGKAWDILLETFVCRPEGGGLLAVYVNQHGLSSFQGKKVAVLMFGHRNTTCLYFDNGIRKVGDSPMLGFSNFLDDVCLRVGFLNRDELADALFAAIKSCQKEMYQYSSISHPNWAEMDVIQNLAKARDKNLRASEVRDIVSAINLSTTDYWISIRKWLDKTLPTFPDYVILGGGAAIFFEPELEEYFNVRQRDYSNTSEGRRGQRYEQRNMSKPYSNLVWLDDISKRAAIIFRDEYRSDSRIFRLLDCFGMLDQLKDLVKEKEADDYEE